MNKDDSIDMTEVVSQGQTAQQMQDKLTSAREQLGRPGVDRVVEADPLPEQGAPSAPSVTTQPRFSPGRPGEPVPEVPTQVEPVTVENIFEIP
ncbi:hypothetical protein [Luteibacter yeojuensis]|uniref:hypothetical protein n=1 Tax=Luteibacter yeojuensis TaxID=345309 RepID=UPI0012EE6193|nr:hypothetical protein [Luteibacter yeojuensis]